MDVQVETATTNDPSPAEPGRETRLSRWAALRARLANTPRWLRIATVLLAVCAAIPATGFSAIKFAGMRIGPLPLDDANAVSVTVLDREDRLLRAFTTSGGRWRLPLDPTEVDPRYLQILMAFEDKRFYEHGGVDYYAVARAGFLLARHGRILSGGSTLTMQVARLLEGKHERTGGGKLRQIARALQLEEKLSKTEILRLYLRLAPFGGNIEGVRAASLAYFGKEPRHLSAGEAALLVALPQSPENRRPDRNSEAARRARDRVLDRAVEAGVPEAHGSRARQDRAHPDRSASNSRSSPRTCPNPRSPRKPGTSIHRLTIDRDLQAADRKARHRADEAARPEAVRRRHRRRSHHRRSAGRTSARPDISTRDRLGAIDMTDAVRSPGSTLKPFIYGLAFEDGLAHPET